jgi:hypothetical protein
LQGGVQHLAGIGVGIGQGLLQAGLQPGEGAAQIVGGVGDDLPLTLQFLAGRRGGAAFTGLGLAQPLIGLL